MTVSLGGTFSLSPSNATPPAGPGLVLHLFHLNINSTAPLIFAGVRGGRRSAFRFAWGSLKRVWFVPVAGWILPRHYLRVRDFFLCVCSPPSDFTPGLQLLSNYHQLTPLTSQLIHADTLSDQVFPPPLNDNPSRVDLLKIFVTLGPYFQIYVLTHIKTAMAPIPN